MEETTTNNKPIIITIAVIAVVLIITLIVIFVRGNDSDETATDPDATPSTVEPSPASSGTPNPSGTPGPSITLDPDNPLDSGPVVVNPVPDDDSDNRGTETTGNEGLPIDWDQLSNEEKTKLNPFNCDLDTQWISAENGQCIDIPKDQNTDNGTTIDDGPDSGTTTDDGSDNGTSTDDGSDNGTSTDDGSDSGTTTDDGTDNGEADHTDPRFNTDAVFRFKDIDADYQFVHAISWLLANEATIGCGSEKPSRHFCPDAPAKRWHMALWLWRFDGSPQPTALGSDIFDDIQYDGGDADEIDKAIGWLSETGITTGCGANNFCPNQAASRQQVAVMIYRYIDSLNDADDLDIGEATTEFIDVDENSFAYTAIVWMEKNGVTQGCSTEKKMFCPAQPATRGQAAKLFFEAYALWYDFLS